MKRNYIGLFVNALITMGWMLIIFLLCKLFFITQGYAIQDSLFFISLSTLIFGLLLIMGRSAARSPVDYTSRSHALLLGRTIHKFLTNDYGRKYGYDYTWKSCFNGYCVLIAGALGLLYDFIFI